MPRVSNNSQIANIFGGLRQCAIFGFLLRIQKRERQMTTGSAPTIEEQIAGVKYITDTDSALGNKYWSSVLASLERLKRLDSQPVPVEPTLWAPEKNGNMMPVAKDERLVEYVWHEDYKKLQSALKLAQEERDAKDRLITNYEEWLSVSGENAKELQERAEKAESLNRRMVEKYRDLVVAAEKIGGKVTDASNLQISIADVLSMKEALAKLDES